MAKKQNEVKICLWTHVQNEAPVIRKMLESAVDYIDYWVLVDNGSTDGTQDIIKDFFEEHNVEGKLYQSEIGWKGHGINRQHSWEFLENTDHGCDYILRIDADEGIKVADDFDWSLIPTQEAWSVIYQAGGHVVPRMWLWKWGLPWYWADDVAHETIHLKDGRVPDSPNLPMSFKHISLGGGNSYSNPIKYIQDIIKLENQLHERFRDGSDLEKERYHMFYLCKSFNYTGYSLDNEWCHKFFPYGKEQLKNFLERGIFYYDQLLNRFGEEWYTYYLKAQDNLLKIGKDADDFKTNLQKIEDKIKAVNFKPISKKEEILPGFELSPKDKDNLYKGITKLDKSGKNEIMRLREKDPEFDLKIAYLATVLKWDFSAFERQSTTKSTRKLADAIKSTKKTGSRPSRGTSKNVDFDTMRKSLR